MKLKKINKWIFVIREEMYLIPLMVIIGTFDEYQKRMFKHFALLPVKQESFGGEACSVHSTDGRVWNVVWLPELKSDIDCLGEILHELHHITDKTMKNIGIKEDYDNNEAATYYLELLYNKFLKAWEKKSH